MLSHRDSRKVVVVGIAIFLLLAWFSFRAESQWIYDNVIAAAVLIILYLARRVLRLGMTEWVLIIASFFIHNLGMFGFYSYQNAFFGYDTIVHAVSAFAASWTAFNFIARRIDVKGKKMRYEEHLLRIFLVFCVVTALGALVEVVEYAGFVYLGEGDGILFMGDGDYNKFGDPFTQYADTIGDILVNALGAFAGALAFDLFLYHRKPWLR